MQWFGHGENGRKAFVEGGNQIQRGKFLFIEIDLGVVYGFCLDAWVNLDVILELVFLCPDYYAVPTALGYIITLDMREISICVSGYLIILLFCIIFFTFIFYLFSNFYYCSLSSRHHMVRGVRTEVENLADRQVLWHAVTTKCTLCGWKVLMTVILSLHVSIST